MPAISQKQKLAEDFYLLKIKAPAITKYAQPGHYVSIQKDPSSKKHSLFITNAQKGELQLVVDATGPAGELTKLKKGDSLHSLCGPLGKSFAINEFGNVIILAEGDGIGPAYFFGQAFKKAGNRVYFISRYPTKKSRFWEKKLSKSFDKWFLVSKKKETTNGIIKELNNLLRKKHVKLTLALCDLSLMEDICHLTKLRSALYCSTLSLVSNGPALCTDCRVGLTGSTKLSCVDGPLFNGHRVEWREVIYRHQKNITQEIVVENNE